MEIFLYLFRSARAVVKKPPILLSDASELNFFYILIFCFVLLLFSQPGSNPCARSRSRETSLFHKIKNTNTKILKNLTIDESLLYTLSNLCRVTERYERLRWNDESETETTQKNPDIEKLSREKREKDRKKNTRVCHAELRQIAKKWERNDLTEREELCERRKCCCCWHECRGSSMSMSRVFPTSMLVSKCSLLRLTTLRDLRHSQQQHSVRVSVNIRCRELDSVENSSSCEWTKLMFAVCMFWMCQPTCGGQIKWT